MQISEFFKKLFDTQDWPARWFCGEWTEFHGWLYIISDLLIWMSYFAIPFFLLAFVFKKDHVPLPKIFWLFGFFILSCGLTHLMDAVTFWWPAYRLSAVIRFITAFASVSTVIALFYFFPIALRLRTSVDFERELKQREEAENQLKKAQAKLEAYNAQLLTKNEEVQQLASIVSHDLQQPLQSFTSVLDLLKKQTPDMKEDTSEYIAFLDESTERMRGLITELLDYARLGTQRQLTEVDMEVVLANTKDDLWSSIEQKEAIITHQSLPVVKGYRTELRLLLQNLLNNSLKFSKENVIPKIHIRAEERENDWLFVVEDNGRGISREDQQKIFMIFQRVHEGEDINGSGIGLAHAKKIVELHRGRIWVESEPRAGSSFFFTIAKNLE